MTHNYPTGIVSRGLIAFAIFAGGFMFSASGITQANAQKAFDGNIPKAWGSVKGSIANTLILEDSSGVIRLVNQRDGSLFFIYARN